MKFHVIFCIGNQRQSATISLLKSRGYKSDPVKAWKTSLEEGEERGEGAGQEMEEGEEESDKKGEEFSYLLDMPMRSLTMEKKEKLIKNRDAKVRLDT